MSEFQDAIQDETIETEPRDTTPPPPDAADIYQESVEVELTDEDKAARRIELESIDREIIRLEEQKKADNKVINGEIKVQKARKDGILAALDSGTEKRMVDCYEHFDERLGKVEVRRVDTDEVVTERAMTTQEREDSAAGRQGDLFASSGSSVPPPDLGDTADPEGDLDEGDFEPDPEALAQGAEDEGRVVRTNSAEARKRRAAKSNGAAVEPAGGDAAE